VGEDTPMTRSVVAALLCSGLMGLATVGVVALHAVMFAVTLTGVDRDTSSAGAYLWIGTLLAAFTAWAAAVLYRAPWQPLTTPRWLVVVGGCAAAAVAMGMWAAFTAA
jgi:hypothetical protein